MKRKKLVSLSALIILLGIQACTHSSNANIEYIPVKKEKGEKWGMVNSSGQFLFNDEFENEPSFVVNGVFYVREGDGYSIYKAEKKPVLVSGAENLKCVGFLTEGVIPIVREGERITLIDQNGKTKTTLNPINGKEIVRCLPFFREGNLVIGVQGDKCGTVDKDGKVVIEPVYDDIVPFSEGICVAIINDKESDTKILVGLNGNGNEIFRIKGPYEILERTYISGYQGGRLVVKKGDVLGYLDRKGEFNKLPSKYIDYSPFTSQYFGVSSSENKCGLINEDNEVLIRPKYEGIDYIGDNLFLAKNENRYQIVTSDGDLKVEIDEHSIESIKNTLEILGFSNSFCFVGGNENSYMLYDKDGKPVSKGDFYEIGLQCLYTCIIPLESDYFDVNGIARYIANAISPEGFERIKLGSEMKEYVNSSDPEIYSDKYGISFDMDKFSFRNATASLEVYPYGGQMVLSEPVYSYENYYGYNYQTFDGYRYSWNPASKVGCIQFTINATRPFFKQCSNQLIELLKNKGFTVARKSDDGDWYLLKSSNSYIEIGPSRGTDPYDDESMKNLAIDLMSEEYYNSRIEP